VTEEPAGRAAPQAPPSGLAPEACPRGVWRGSTWRACLGRGCPACGPVVRAVNLAHDEVNLGGGGQVTRRLVPRAAWPEIRGGIRAAGGRRVAYPQPGDRLAVYATAGMVGAVVEDLGGALAADYDRLPARAPISRSPGWALRLGLRSPGWALGLGSRAGEPRP
jgi:hypothetical protein